MKYIRYTRTVLKYKSYKLDFRKIFVHFKQHVFHEVKHFQNPEYIVYSSSYHNQKVTTVIPIIYICHTNIYIYIIHIPIILPQGLFPLSSSLLNSWFIREINVVSCSCAFYISISISQHSVVRILYFFVLQWFHALRKHILGHFIIMWTLYVSLQIILLHFIGTILCKDILGENNLIHDLLL